MSRHRVVRRWKHIGPAGSFGALLFFASAGLVVSGLVLPHDPRVDERGMVLLGFADLACGALLLALGRRARAGWVPSAVTVLGIVSVSVAIAFDGERNGGPATFCAFFYVWPAIYAANFCRLRGIVAAIGAIGGGYAALLATTPLPEGAAMTRWNVVVGVSATVAVVLFRVRRQREIVARRLEMAARTDPLTGLANRRALEDRFELERDRASRFGRPLALLLGDLDGFKQLNDTLGHATGDVALERIADALREAARSTDLVSRMGGDEFVLLLPETDHAQALEVAARVTDSVSALQFEGLRLGISWGIAQLGIDGDSLSGLTRAADEELYECKRRRRALRPQSQAV